MPMPTPDDENWEDLDAFVVAEADRIVRPRPIPEPEVDEAVFLDRAAAFLNRHADPVRLIAELQRRTAAAPAVESEPSPAPEPPGDPTPEPPSEAAP